jgi:hypothetical protein
VPGCSAFAGDLRGRAAFIGCIRGVVARFEVELIDMLVADERVALLLRERLGGPDGDVEIRRANVYRVRYGRIVEVWIFEHDQYAVDELLGGP